VRGEYTGGGEMAWTAEVIDGAEWLHITSGSSGTNSGAVNVSCDQNDDQNNTRTGTIRITAAGATGSPVDVTVVQTKHPWPGDANEDGWVNFSDYLVLSQNFGSGGSMSAEEVAKFQAGSAVWSWPRGTKAITALSTTATATSWRW